MVYLIGPGGAGKTTVGSVLASLSGRPFGDLDAHFAARHGDIDRFIEVFGYRAYARANIDVWLELARTLTDHVMAFSSGFMTYPPDAHSRYAGVRDAVLRHPATFVLLPSLDLEACVAETIHRQTRRGAGRTTAARAEAKTRERFAAYVALGPAIITTMRRPIDVASDIASRLPEIGAPEQPNDR